MSDHPRRWAGLVMIPLILGTVPAGAQRPARQAERVKLSAVIGAFLVDSGVRTRGLPWTTGSELPIKWESAVPVANPDQSSRAKGLTLIRTGAFTGTAGDTVALPMSVTLSGAPTGLASVTLSILSTEVTLKGGGGFFATREMIEQALRNEGVQLQPLRCSREKEGASYGNLVDAVKLPGKTASGLWWFWQSPQQVMSISLTILYRRADMAQVECQGD